MYVGEKMSRITGKEMARPRGRPSKARQDPGSPVRTIGIRSTDSSKLIDAALVDYLKAKGFDEPAPPRF